MSMAHLVAINSSASRAEQLGSNTLGVLAEAAARRLEA
jgi:hypothetical protein